MKLTDQLVITANAYCEATGRSSSRVSSMVFGDGKRAGDGTKLAAIMSGGADITTRRFEAAMRWFSENWPEGADWPEGVARPAAEVAT